MSQFSENLRETIKKKNLSNAAVAEAIGVNAPTFISWIEGRVEPYPQIIPMLCRAIGCEESDLYGNHDEEEDPVVKTNTESNTEIAEAPVAEKEVKKIVAEKPVESKEAPKDTAKEKTEKAEKPEKAEKTEKTEKPEKPAEENAEKTAKTVEKDTAPKTSKPTPQKKTDIPVAPKAPETKTPETKTKENDKAPLDPELLQLMKNSKFRSQEVTKSMTAAGAVDWINGYTEDCILRMQLVSTIAQNLVSAPKQEPDKRLEKLIEVAKNASDSVIEAAIVFITTLQKTNK